MNAKKRFLIPLLATLISACGGGGGGGAAPAPAPGPTNQSPTGIWLSTYVASAGTNAGNTIKELALVAPNGSYYFAAVNQNNGCANVGFGQASVTGSAFSGTEADEVVTYTTIPGVNVTCTFPDGSTTATGTITGTVTTGQSLSVTSSGKTALGTAVTGQPVSFSYGALNGVAPSLATIAGNYTTPSGSTVTVSATGAISEVNVVSGCNLSGQISIPSTTNNIYAVTISYSGCSAGYTALNGVTATGLGAYDNSVTPNEFDLGFSATVSGQTAVIAEYFVKQ